MQKTTPYKKPILDGEYVNVYIPKPGVYEGNKSVHFSPGEFYGDWVPNDFTVTRDAAGFVHIIGITHPRPPSFRDSFNFDETAHDAEHQLFHCVSPSPSIGGCLYEGSFREEEKLLWAPLRPNEQPECWAPCLYKKGDGDYYLFYSPRDMRLARTADLYSYTFNPPLFRGGPMMRDPFVIEDGGEYHMIYLEDCLLARRSKDLVNWSAPETFQKNPFGGVSAQESPFVFVRDGAYYLTWCIHDGTNGCYDNRTFVFVSDSLYGFDGKAPIAMLPGHAPEFVNEGDDWYIVSVYYPKNGINIARLRFVSEEY